MVIVFINKKGWNMFSSKLSKVFASLLIVVGLSATITMSAGAAGGPLIDSTPPGGSFDRSYTGEIPLPWEHTVVIVHILDGSGQNESAAPNHFDPYSGVPSLAEFATGERPYIVDWIITSGPYGGSLHDPGTGWGGGSVSDIPYDGGYYGRVAEGLSKAGQLCSNHYWSICDIVLVTYEAPSEAHQRHAMAEAMHLATAGYNLHTVAINPNDCALQPCFEVTPVHPEAEAAHARHQLFSSLLGANGYSAVVDSELAHLAIDEVVLEKFYWTSVDCVGVPYAPHHDSHCDSPPLPEPVDPVDDDCEYVTVNGYVEADCPTGYSDDSETYEGEEEEPCEYVTAPDGGFACVIDDPQDDPTVADDHTTPSS